MTPTRRGNRRSEPGRSGGLLPIRDRWRYWVIIVAALATVAIVLVLGIDRTRPSIPSEQPRGSASVAASSAPSAVRLAFKHVWLIVMENKNFDQIVGASTAPYLNSLIAKSGLATAYRAVTHPSQPNYFALFSGSVQGVADDRKHDITAPSIADQLEAAGLTWRVYAENVPSGCDVSARATNGPDGLGTYARKHEPAISFTAINGDAKRCANIVPFTGFDPAAASFELIVPNLCNDMHDCAVGIGDTFLRDFAPKITESGAWRDGGVLFVTWDEAFDSPQNQVATIIASPLVPSGYDSSVPHTHYSLLRTIQEGFSLACLAESCKANTLAEFFAKPIPVVASPSG